MAARSAVTVFLLAIVLSAGTGTGTGSAGGGESEWSNSKVSVALYYESLCPYCSNFIVNHLAPIFHNGLISVVRLDLLPYGNARVRSNGTITCQKSAMAFSFAALFLLSTLSLCAVARGDSSASRVPLALYYETLCPYSANFIVNYLAPIFHNGIISIVDLDLIPYGNARVHSNGTITCQHGEYECLLNTIEACAIDAWPDLDVHFGFINCVETLVVEHKYLEWESCFATTGLDPKPVSECYQNGYGHELELEYAAKTDALEPPHKYVPWVVVNGEPLYEDYENFEAYICKAYKGNNRPEVCDEVLLKMPKEKESRNAVCHKTDAGLVDEMRIEMVV